MDTFIVEVCRGIVTNSRRGTSRTGFWIPIQSLPRDIAKRWGADKGKARQTLGFDLHNRQWRDMKNATRTARTYCTATAVTMDDGYPSIALLDF